MPKKHSVEEDVVSFCGWPFLADLLDKTPSKYKPVFSALFETGGRVSEVLMLRGENLDLKAHPDIILVRNMPILKRYEKVGEKRDPVTGKTRWITERRDDYRTFPIVKKEPLVDYLLPRIKKLKNEKELLFPFSRLQVFFNLRKVGRRLNRMVPNSKVHSSELYPHLLRSERACQLVDEYSFDIYNLDWFFGWKKRKLSTAERYARMGWKGLARRMGINV